MKANAFLFLLCTAAYSVGAVSADIAYWQSTVNDAPTVAAVERALRTQGYDPGPADGTADAKTLQALKQAQKDRELEPTGRLDRRTIAALGIDVTRAPGSPH